MKVKLIEVKEVDAKETKTVGKFAYLVALCCGGVMEDPDIHYTDYQIIRADSPKEAEDKYNLINNCSYYYGTVIRRIFSINKRRQKINGKKVLDGNK